MDLNDIYGGIISPQGGLYKPQGSDVYSGIIPPSVPSSGLKTNTVNTVPINPITGNPYGAPPNEVKVPGGTNTGLGYQSGQSFPDSYRLLPTGPLSIAGETPATNAIQTATKPNTWAGLGITLPGSLASMLGAGATSQPYAGVGVLAPGAGDPWASMVSPRQQAARKATPPPIPSAVLALANSINSGAKPDTNTVIRTINQSGNKQQARDVIGQAMGDQIRKTANPGKSVTGIDMAFAPKSVQNSVLWNTGYK